MLEPHRPHPRGGRRAAEDRARSTASSSPSPTRCPTASPPRSSRPRARSSTPGTSSSTRRRSTAGSPTSPSSARSPGGACASCCPTPPTPRSPATPRRSRPSAWSCGSCSGSTPAAGSSPPASPATSTGCSRSPRRPSRPGGKVAFLGRSMIQNVALARSMGLLSLPRRSVVDIDEIGRFEPGEICRDLHRLPGRAAERAGPHGRPREPPGQAGRQRHGDHLGHPDPRQRDQRVPGHRRALPGRAPTWCTPAWPHVHVSGHAAQEELKFLLNLVHARVLRARPRRVPPPGPPRPPGPGHWAWPKAT